MKTIKINNDYPSTVCRVGLCPYRKSCANHYSAGDFRTEGGVSPRLTIIGNEIHCSTFAIPVDEEYIYDEVPVEPHGMGYVEFESLTPHVDPGTGI